MNDDNLLFAQDIDNPRPGEKPFEGSPAEVYNAFRQGQKNIPPEGKYQALQSTQYHFSPAFKGVWDPKWKGMMPMPNWTPDQYEDFSKKSPMSNLDLISKLLKSG